MSGHRAGHGPAIWFSSTRDFDPLYQPTWVNPLYEVPNVGLSMLRVEDCKVVASFSTLATPGTGAVSLTGSAFADILRSLFYRNTAEIGGALALSVNATASVVESV